MNGGVGMSMSISLRLQKLEDKRNEAENRKSLQQTIDFLYEYFTDFEKYPPRRMSDEELAEIEAELCRY